METCFEYLDYESAFFSTDQKKWIDAVYKFREEHPDDIEIIKEPSQNDGCLYAKVPVKYFKLSPPRKRNMSEEQVEAARERGRMLAEKHKENAKRRRKQSGDL